MPSEIQSELPLPDDQYNTGDKDDKRAALTMVATYATSLLTLATATIALSATFIKDLYQGQDLWALLMAWGLLAASMVAAFLTLGQNISLLAESDLRPRRGLIEILGLVHLILVLAGLAFFAFFAVQNATTSAASSPGHDVRSAPVSGR
jgi:hypothetical protein